MIEHLVNLMAIELMNPHQIGQNSRVHRSGARSHHNSVERGKSHRGVHTSPTIYSSDRAPVPDVATHQFERAQVSIQQLRGPFRTILMINAVKSIATNPALEPTIRPGISCRFWRHLPVKSGIENRYLGNS